MKRTSFLVLILLAQLNYGQVFGQNDVKTSIFDYLSFQEVIEVELSLDFDAQIEDRRNDDKLPALLNFQNAHGQTESWDIKVKQRGKFRRAKCAGMPPLKLYFDKDDLKEAGLAKFNDYKMVNYCAVDKELAKDLLLREFVSYQMYNAVSEYSYRVQMLKITFKDTKSKRKLKQYAFLIEDTAELLARTDLEKLTKDMVYTVADIKNSQIQSVALYQYLIGNTDFNFLYQRNSKLFMKGKDLVVIPYDFDYSGLVNPPYAAPNPNYNVATLTERVFLGFTDLPTELNNGVSILRANKERFLEIIDQNTLLKSYSKREMRNYIESFYDDVETSTVILENTALVDQE